MQPAPTTSAAISILGGILIAATGLPWGYVVLFAGIIVYSQPKHHVAWGIVVLLLSALALVAQAPAGLFGLAGGVAMIAWKPPVVQSAIEQPR